jgi:molybdopterin-containing oxidoreductase family iron-sulfur binding subunit
MKTTPPKKPKPMTRRDVLKGLFTLATAVSVSGCRESRDALAHYVQKHFREMSEEELKEALRYWESRYQRQYGKAVTVNATPPNQSVLWGYALDIARCVGCRRCVYACVTENNQSRDPQLHWITVLQMDKERGVDLQHSDAYYQPSSVPEEGKFYFPVSCQQCEKPPCVKVCPVKATWKEDDGVVVVDYDWCIGCRCCITACPYGARHFNWTDPTIPADQLQTKTEYLGNRPRIKGVVEKCTFCLQRARQGLYPACVEVCPVGARKFGNLLDPDSEVRYILKNKRVLVLKEELNTQPKFFYYFST